MNTIASVSNTSPTVVPSASVATCETRLDRFERGVEKTAGFVTHAAGVVGGAWIACEGATLAAGVTGLSLVAAPAALVALGAIGGALGFYLARQVNREAGEIGRKLSSRLGMTPQAGSTVGKTALALGRSALLAVFAGLAIGHPVLVPVLGVAVVGAGIAGGGLTRLANKS